MVAVLESLVQVHNLLTGAVSQLRPGHKEPVTALATISDPAPYAAVAIVRTDGSTSVVDAIAEREVHCVKVPAF